MRNILGHHNFVHNSHRTQSNPIQSMDEFNPWTSLVLWSRGICLESTTIYWLVTMTTRQLCWPSRPFRLAVVLLSLILFFLSFFQRLITEVARLSRSSRNFDTCSVVTLIYKIHRSEIRGSLPQIIWRPKNIKIWPKVTTTSQFYRNYLWKQTKYRRMETALQTAISPAYMYLIRWTLVHKWRKRTRVSTGLTCSRYVGYVSYS